MKRLILMGALVGAFAASSAFAQSGMSGTTSLGSVHINMNVLADGKPLAAGTYQVRLTLANPAGFELNASSFSGSIRSELALTIGGGSDASRSGGRRRDAMSTHNMRATYGDGSATLTIHTFSGDVVIAKR